MLKLKCSCGKPLAAGETRCSLCALGFAPSRPVDVAANYQTGMQVSSRQDSGLNCPRCLARLSVAEVAQSTCSHCRVLECFDSKERKYYLAIADAAARLEELRQRNLAYVAVPEDEEPATGDGPGGLSSPTRPGPASQSWEQQTGARAFCPPLTDCAEDPCAHDGGSTVRAELGSAPESLEAMPFGYHRDTERTEPEEHFAFPHHAHPPRCLGGEFPAVVEGNSELEFNKRAGNPRSVPLASRPP